MADLKPIGSEKLTGQDKIKRIMEIARFKETIPTKINETSRGEYSLGLADGNNYQIVKEKLGYIIKKTISESETDYIEPMKNRKYYSSYSQALKRLNLLAGELNRLNENEEGVDLFGEQKKFVLKTPKPAQPEVDVPSVDAAPAAPPAVPSPELPPSPVSAEGGDIEGDLDMSAETTPDGGEEVDMDAEVGTDMGGEEMGAADAEEKVTFKSIQKLTGKLTQKLRVLDNETGMTSEDIKYVINMVLSALNLSELSDEDKEDIMSKFEGESEDMGGDDKDGTDYTDDTEVEDIQSDMDTEIGQGGDMEAVPEVGEGHGAILDSIFGESKVDKVISKYFEFSKKEILENQKRNLLKKKRIQENVKNKISNVTKFSQTVEQELAAKKFLEENFGFQFVGITNKKNLVFENKNKQIKVTPEGIIK